MKYIDVEIPQLVNVFSYLFQAQSNASASENYNAYFMLVDQLETLASSALNEAEKENVRLVKKIIRDYTRHLSEQVLRPTDFHEVDEEKMSIQELNYLRSVIVEYPLKRLIAKIYTAALSKTILKDVIPPDADYFDFESELQDTLEEIAFNLESLGYEPLRVEYG